MADIEKCHCGLPLHYTDPAALHFVNEMIRLKGPNAIVTVDGRSWSVPRHYIALHGLKGSEVASLGFDEVTAPAEPIVVVDLTLEE